jgi:PAS domain S-box-containing protein
MGRKVAQMKASEGRQELVEEALPKRGEEAKRLAQENAIMAQIGRIISSTLNIEQVYEQFAKEARKLIPFDRIIINLIDRQEGTITNAYVSGIEVAGRRPGDIFPLRGSLNEKIMETKKSVLIQTDDPEELTRSFPTLLSTFQAGLRSMMSVPLSSQDQVIGGLHFRSTRLGAYSEKDLKLAESIAAQIAGAIANAQLFSQRKRAEEALRKSEEEAKRLAYENAIMAEIGQIISSTLNIEEVYESFANEAQKLIPFDRISINLINLEDGTVVVAYVSGLNVPGRLFCDTYLLKDSATEKIMSNRLSLLIQPETKEELEGQFPKFIPHYQAGLRSMMAIPLVSRDTLIGVLHLQSAKIKAYTDQDLRLAERIASQIAGAIANAQLFVERKRTEEALQASEEKYRLLVQISNDAIFIAQDGVIKFPNPKAEQFLGYSADELARTPFVKYVHPDDREMVMERYNKRLDGHKFPNTYPFRVIDKSGQEFWAEVNAVLIQWEGRPATLNFVRDITEKKRLEAQFLQAQKMEAVGTLAGGIAHDFNNLLMGIQGNTSLMLLDTDSSHPHYKMLKSMEEQVKSGADLTWQLLSFARGGKYEVKPTDLNTIVKKSSGMFGRAKKEVGIFQNLQPDLWTVEVDRGQIEQVLLNLYVNAWQAMPGGGSLFLETKNVTLDENYVRPINGKAGNYAKISVTDTGVGMDEKTRKRIFEPFFTTKEMGRGTGLGLATAYGIVTGHGGFITVYSQKGHGATFDIYLPASEKKVEKEKKPLEELLRGNEAILLVDDEDVVINVSRMLLEALGYKVFMARSGQDAIELYKAKREEVDLVIMDMIMPGMSGENAIDLLKTMNPEVKVILSSGYSLDGQATRIMERGCQGFIQKPFSAREISQKIREALDKGIKDQSAPDMAVPG